MKATEAHLTYAVSNMPGNCSMLRISGINAAKFKEDWDSSSPRLEWDLTDKNLIARIRTKFTQTAGGNVLFATTRVDPTGLVVKGYPEMVEGDRLVNDILDLTGWKRAGKYVGNYGYGNIQLWLFSPGRRNVEE